jgi:ribosomal protein S18 acetylase RimI-like enzyme
MDVSASSVRELTYVAPPNGYVLRPYRQGDEASWLRLLNLAGFPKWDRRRLDAYLGDAERREGSRVVVKGTAIVAATFASRATLEQQVGVLDYVACHPQHRRKGLGLAVCTAVLKFLVGRSYPGVTLNTYDSRLPAISLYLSLGFAPVMVRGDMPSRWEAVMRGLKSGRQ